MIVLNAKMDEITKKKIVVKDNEKLKYEEKINLIKQHYGVEFNVNHFDNCEIDTIKFVNLKHKKDLENVSISYDVKNNKISYIDYDFNDTRIVKGMNHKKFVSDIEKEHKLNLVVGEVQRANTEYIEELKKIEEYYNSIVENNNNYEKELLIQKDNKND